MKMRLIHPGVRTTCQDLGRPGYEAIGIAPAGAADRISYALVNWLLGNARNTPALEILLGGLELEVASSHGMAAIGGAQMHATLNEIPLPNWSRFRLQKGDRLRFGYAAHGQIAYLGIAGGFSCPKFFNSVSVNVREKLGEVLQADTVLHTSVTQQKHLLKAKLHPSLIPKWDENGTLRLRYLPGYQSEWFDRETFEKSTYMVTEKHDKMGYRLKGTRIPPRHTQLISEGIVYGAIQITHDGDPIVLLSEHQTIGGYPKIGTILPTDGYALSQMTTGARIIFEAIDPLLASSLLSPQRIEEIPWFPY
jgi:biotin-dependent carboxylase-like uncharacterized protein